MANIDTMLKNYQLAFANIDAPAISKNFQLAFANIDTAAILKNHQHAFVNIDTIFKNYQLAFANINTAAILRNFQVSIADFVASSFGQAVLDRAPKVLAQAEMPAGELPVVQALDAAQLQAATVAIARLPELAQLPEISEESGLDWVLAAAICEVAEGRGETGPTVAQTAIMTMVIVCALTAVIAVSPALTTAFGLASIPVTLWPFIKSLVTDLNKTPLDEEI